MKRLENKSVSKKISWMMVGMALLFVFSGCKKGHQTPTLSITTVASGLHGPMGIEADRFGNIWVTEGGTNIPDAKGNTHNDNGKVLVITPNGKKFDAVINLSSFTNIHSGEAQGTSHILLDGGTLYVLSGDYLYKVDVSHFKAGDKPIDAKTLKYEDVAAVIGPINSPNNPTHDSHPYNLTKGPDGDLYITDAGANAVVHRKGVNKYVVLAEFPGIANPLFPGLGGPMVQSVPTSIRFDGKDFLVTVLTGFPFPAGQAIIYRVSLTGNMSVYQKGFTMLVDQAQGYYNNPVFVQHAASFNPATGFGINSGSIVWANGTDIKVLADGLNQPVGIKQVNSHTWYVTCLGDGSVLKVTYD